MSFIDGGTSALSIRGAIHSAPHPMRLYHHFSPNELLSEGKAAIEKARANWLSDVIDDLWSDFYFNKDHFERVYVTFEDEVDTRAILDEIDPDGDFKDKLTVHVAPQ